MTPQTKIVGNFLVEFETLENGSVVFKETDHWRGASMTFAHILQDNDENFVTVHQTERETLTGRMYLMDTETYEELKTVSEDFEESLSNENDIFVAGDYKNVQSDIDISDNDTSDHQEPDCHDRRTDAIEAIVMQTFFLNLNILRP